MPISIVEVEVGHHEEPMPGPLLIEPTAEIAPVAQDVPGAEEVLGAEEEQELLDSLPNLQVG